MKSDGEKQMDSRIGHLEQAVAVLQDNVGGLRSTTDKNSQVLNAVMQKLTEMDQRKPFSVGESLRTILTTLGIFTIIIAALTYKIDAQATAKAEPAIKMAEMLMKDGEYFILRERVSRLEQALAWKPVVVSAEVASRR
jgi:uncharacterized coiled-coil protein SlyX